MVRPRKRKVGGSSGSAVSTKCSRARERREKDRLRKRAKRAEQRAQRAQPTEEDIQDRERRKRERKRERERLRQRAKHAKAGDTAPLTEEKNGCNRGRVRYGTFEELSWLQEAFSEEEWNSLKRLWPPDTKRTRSCCYGNSAPSSGYSWRTWLPGAAAALRSIPTPPSSTSQDNPLVVPFCWPPVPADEPRCWVLVSVPHSALTAASTMTLSELLSSNDKALCALPDGHLVSANGAQLKSWLPAMTCERNARVLDAPFQ
ncbi:uncharacterized protein LOC144127595 isoform X2 [Amblyomma americanum]